MMNTNQKGNIGLAKVIAELNEKGYNCFLPFTDTTCIDVIITNKKMQTCRIQVKHKKIRKGCIRVRCASVVNRKDVFLNKKFIDYFAVYCPDNKQIYYIPIKVFKKCTNLSIRVEELRYNLNTVKLAKHFLDFKF